MSMIFYILLKKKNGDVECAILPGSLSNDDGDGKTRTIKSNRFGLAKQQLCTCITLFYTVLICLCTTSA